MAEPNLEALVELLPTIARMRYAQRQYFKTRAREWMYRAKALERDVDKLLERGAPETVTEAAASFSAPALD